MTKTSYLASKLLKPYNFGKPLKVKRIYDYLAASGASSLPWFENISVLDHIANVALFSVGIAQKAKKRQSGIDIHKVWLMGWLRDIGRIPWGIAVKQNITDITKRFGHHGYLGYWFLKNCRVPEDLAIISMTHIGSGVTAKEVKKINQILKKEVFPVRDWYAKTLEEMVVVIADKIPGWNNNIVAHYNTNLKGEKRENKIYSWLENQDPLWIRFWAFKKRVDKVCGGDVLKMFNQGLLVSQPEAFASLPKARVIAKMKY